MRFLLVSLLLLPVGAVHSASQSSKQNCEIALASLGYKIVKHAFEEAGWVTRAKHIFNDDLICYVNTDKSVHSISDKGTTIVEDGFYGKKTLEAREVLESERDTALKAAKLRINKEFDEKIEKLKRDSEPAATAEARKARAQEAVAARKAEEERIAREKTEAEVEIRKAEELARQKRQAEIDKITSRTGSTVSIDIKDEAGRACADLLAGHVPNIDVHHVKSESFWGGKYTVWYRDRHSAYSPDQYNTRKCQIKGGSVQILSVFQSWD